MRQLIEVSATDTAHVEFRYAVETGPDPLKQISDGQNGQKVWMIAAVFGVAMAILMAQPLMLLLTLVAVGFVGLYAFQEFRGAEALKAVPVAEPAHQLPQASPSLALPGAPGAALEGVPVAPRQRRRVNA